MPSSKTHFEQIPVETVMKIAQEVHKQSAIENESEAVEKPATSAQERWREVAEKVQQEQDPRRMIGLVEQLIATFDEEELGKRLPSARDTPNRSRPTQA